MYQIKWTQELIWALLVAGVTAAAQFVQAQGTAPPSDWGVWLLALVAAIARPIGAILWNIVTGVSTGNVTGARR